jgi:hypothetical protein
VTNDNFPNGVRSFGVPVNGLFTNGNPWFCSPATGAPGYPGNDGNDGQSPQRPFATLKTSLSKATAGNNDVIYMIASSDTASATSDYQSSSLLWNKDLTHLVGINANPLHSQRSRIAQLSTATGITGLLNVSANDCVFRGIEVFHGVGDATSKGCVIVSGERNHFYDCHFAGTGASQMDVAGAYSLTVTGQENFFEDCTIGLDTITRSTSTYEMYMSGGATRNVFRRCRICTSAGANTMTFLTIPTSGVDRWNMFEDCVFINTPAGGVAGATSLTQGFAITGGGSPDGVIILKDCKFVGMSASESSASSRLFYYANGTGKMVSTAF